jgi:filamin
LPSKITISKQDYSTSVKKTYEKYEQFRLDNILISPTLIPYKLSATIRMPSGGTDKPTVVDNHDGTISVKYDPKQEGNYELQIKYNNEHIQGSPFKFYIDSTNKGLVTAFGP